MIYNLLIPCFINFVISTKGRNATKRCKKIKSNARAFNIKDVDFFTDFSPDMKLHVPKTKSQMGIKGTDGDNFGENIILPQIGELENNKNKKIEFSYTSDEAISPPMPASYKLVWQDEFDGNKLDLKKWEHEINCWGGGNNEKQCYVAHDDVIQIKNGTLIMTAIDNHGDYVLKPEDGCNIDASLKADGGCTKPQPIRSGKIKSKLANGGKWKYGRFEMRAILPVGNYLWPAFWMLPTEYKFGNWAASGEFDIMESRGQKPDEIGHALHYGGKWPHNVYSNKVVSTPNLANGFHTYGLDWTQDAIRFFVDDQYTYQVDANRDWTAPGLKDSPYSKKGEPWDQEFQILLNLAVGGNFFPGGTFNPEVDPKTWSRSFIVDYVRVYQKA